MACTGTTVTLSSVTLSGIRHYNDRTLGGHTGFPSLPLRPVRLRAPPLQVDSLQLVGKTGSVFYLHSI